jgi:hypothetical protein
MKFREKYIVPEDPNSNDAKVLMELLSDTLQCITGDSGKNSFDVRDVTVGLPN